jgi:hypothetical protein
LLWLHLYRLSPAFAEKMLFTMFTKMRYYLSAYLTDSRFCKKKDRPFNFHWITRSCLIMDFVSLFLVLKQISISILLFVAFGLFQAHNVIPHHHQEVAKKHTSHHHHHSHGHDHSQGNDSAGDTSLPLPSHDADFGTAIFKKAVAKAEYSQVVADAICTPFSYSPAFISESPPGPLFFAFIDPIVRPFYSYGLPLRAPPCAAVFSC